jgi:hypothetical protein
LTQPQACLRNRAGFFIGDMRMPQWRARSASDKTDDWPFWYVTKDTPSDYNDTREAIEYISGRVFTSLPFALKETAFQIADIMNEGQET